MTSKTKSKQQEALQFLDDLDSFTPPETDPSNSASKSSSAGQPTGNEGEAEVLAFLDEITQKSAEPTRPASVYPERPISRSGTPTLRKSTERVKLGGGSVSPPVSSSAPSLSRTSSTTEKAKADSVPASRGGSWGWGSVWSTASAAIQQAKTVVDEQVKALPSNEHARKWGEGVIEYAKAAQLDKLDISGQDFKRVGLSTLTDILNVVAPPISEHEVIQIWLSHEMQGYEGVESLVYSALSRVMEQVEGGDLVVNRGDESRPKATGTQRNFNAVEGYEAAHKLAQADIEELIRNKAKVISPRPPATQTPTTYSHVYLRVQPYYTSPGSIDLSQTSDTLQPRQLQFLLYLSDPEHQLSHTTITQAVPGNWLDFWDEFDWVEDLVAEAVRVGVEVVGQEYLVARMGWGQAKNLQVDANRDNTNGESDTKGVGEES
ncbi:hypothetical protein C0995_011278 [Termitomyces sp. Mi166|nr:hypothetical protein C0995_011278 [Termitomyces sp. Mi166\